MKTYINTQTDDSIFRWKKCQSVSKRASGCNRLYVNNSVEGMQLSSLQ